EEHAALHDEHGERRQAETAVSDADHRMNVAGVLDEAALQPADERIGLAAPDGQRADDGGIGAHDGARRIGGDAAPADEAMEEIDIVAIARIVLGIDKGEILAGFQRQAEAFEPLLDDGGAADED